MPTAKSYENMEIVGEPFESEGKMYVHVKGNCPRCGGSGQYSYNPMYGTVCFQCRGSGKQVMDVRWYTEGQRASMIARPKNVRLRKRKKTKSASGSRRRARTTFVRSSRRTTFHAGGADSTTMSSRTWSRAPSRAT